MTRQTEILSRSDFFACCPADLVECMAAELNAWDGGDTCQSVECTTDSLGQIDSESSPRPGGTINSNGAAAYSAVVTESGVRYETEVARRAVRHGLSVEDFDSVQSCDLFMQSEGLS